MKSRKDWQPLKAYLFPRDEEKDAAFRTELEGLAVIGLRAISCVCLGASLMVLSSRLVVKNPLSMQLDFWQSAVIIALGAVALPLSLIPSVRPRARLLGSLVGYLVALTFIVSSVWVSRGLPDAVHHVPGNITLVLLVGLAALPLKPLQTLAIGLSIVASYQAVLSVAPSFGIYPISDPMHIIFTLIVVFICAGLTAVIYSQRSSAYRARQQALRSFEDLRTAQARLLLSENAASQARLAAALSHELNSPIGALGSALETMLLVFKKEQENRQEAVKLAEILTNAANITRESCRRLTEIIGRMQRFTNLDRAEIQAVDINEVLADTVALLQSELSQKADVKLDLKQVPILKCQPQQLSAVFSNLLRNAAAAIDGKGNIWVSSTRRNGEIVIQVRDDGRGIPAERLPSLLEPTLAVTGGRIATTNWGLFSSRSIIVEHGGHIEIDSTEGKGTTVTVLLPTSSGSIRV
jgi:signal transduction histidine kinase